MKLDSDIMRWEHFRSAPLNKTGSDDEAKAMFEKSKAEVKARDWSWYRDHHETDESARDAWRHQRIRYGLPVN